MISRKRDREPPRFFRWLLCRALPSRLREEQLRDLDEELALRGGTHREALRWYRWQVLRSLAPAIASRIRGAPSDGRAILPASHSGPFTRLGDEVRDALRSLRRDPGFSLLAVSLMAIGIGANTAAFTVVNAVLMRPLPYTDPERIVYVYGSGVTADDVDALAAQVPSLSAVAAHGVERVTVQGSGVPVRTTVMPVSRQFFEILDVPVALGRLLTSEDHLGDAEGTAVVSHSAAETLFGSATSALGGRVAIEGQFFTVVGVTAAGYRFERFSYTDLWVPAGRLDAESRRVIARRRPGATLETVTAELARFATRRRPNTAVSEGRAYAETLHAATVGFYTDELRVLSGVVLLVLLVASANVANLMLVRNERRRPELAVRVALGASRGRLARHVVVEALCLGIAAASVGALASGSVVRGLLSLQPASLPRAETIGFDLEAALFTIAVAVTVALLTGLAPAITLPERGGIRGTSIGVQRSRSALPDVLVVAEVAIATTLLIGTALLLRTYLVLLPSEPGFEASDRLAFRLELSRGEYPDPESRQAVFRALIDELTRIPGVIRVSATTDLPMTKTNVAFRIPLEDAADGLRRMRAVHVRAVTPNYFDALGMVVPRGRGILPTDEPGAPEVAVVNEAMATEFWPGNDPLGARIRIPTPERGEIDVEVVGVLANAWISPGSDEPRPELFVPYAQERSGSFALLVEAEDPNTLVPGVIDAVRQHVPDVPIVGPNRRFDRPRLLADVLSDAMAPWRYQVTLVGFFAGVALFLTGSGLYGVLSAIVRRQRRAIGVRMALGGTRLRVGAAVLSRGMTLMVLGLGIGILVATGSTRLLQAFLFGVDPLDPLGYTAAAMIVLLVGSIASLVPVRRAASTPPLTVLRHE